MRVDLMTLLLINTLASTRLQRPPILHTIALHLALTRLLRMQLVLSDSLLTPGAAAHYTYRLQLKPVSGDDSSAVL